MGGLNAEAAAQANAWFESMVEQSFAVLLPNGDDFNLAREYLGNFETGLRAGDALHLAITKNHQAEAIYSLDKMLLTAQGRSGSRGACKRRDSTGPVTSVGNMGYVGALRQHEDCGVSKRRSKAARRGSRTSRRKSIRML